MGSKNFNLKTVITLYKQLNDAGIAIWLDGGWGVDALLGRQTRKYADLDIIVQEIDVDRARKLLEQTGYVEIKRDDI